MRRTGRCSAGMAGIEAAFQAVCADCSSRETGTARHASARAPATGATLPTTAGVVVALEKLEANFKGMAGRNPNAEGNAVRAGAAVRREGGVHLLHAAAQQCAQGKQVCVGCAAPTPTTRTPSHGPLPRPRASLPPSAVLCGLPTTAAARGRCWRPKRFCGRSGPWSWGSAWRRCGG